eukprot:TRINITY_DN5262_c0_g1_i2.p4 TRINITY_DN5262_c0_g1~~TRINITY_DN5262_c0_g1_i2.p4  ORF type:complete len:121 (-),score=3.11 TRINITY_DN5262_c0_g1_i2:68-430(-)
MFLNTLLQKNCVCFGVVICLNFFACQIYKWVISLIVVSGTEGVLEQQIVGLLKIFQSCQLTLNLCMHDDGFLLLLNCLESSSSIFVECRRYRNLPLFFFSIIMCDNYCQQQSVIICLKKN